MQLHAQSVYFNITKPGNTETFYTWIQSEIKIKTVGIFSDTLFSAGNTIYQVTRYRNFEAPGETNNIWTIVDK